MRQERYASSAEIERGLLGTMVARRCSVLDKSEDRELIWWLHFMSHRDGGLKVVVAKLLTDYADRLGTDVMRRLGKRGGNYTADQVREIRADLPEALHAKFLLKGEGYNSYCGIFEPREDCDYEDRFNGDQARAIEQADRRPNSYAVVDFETLCRTAAESGDEEKDCLESELRRLCLDPAQDLTTAAPWYFAELISALRDYMRTWIATRKSATVVTSLGQKICDVLEYTGHSQSMTLVEGDARIGKSFSARAWCEQHPGQSRFIEVPTGNAEKDFFLALARGLGLGNFTQYKAGEIRERVESVLLTRDLLLCLDEAHRLWPEVNPRYGFPKRINWLMSLANQGVPICLIGTPQFIERQKSVEQSGWNAAQFIGRIGHYEPLPRELSLEDLVAVAKSVLPEADSQTKRALAAYARKSAKYLAAIEAIAKRARYIAMKSGRTKSSTEDVLKAMKESVIPADSKLVKALRPETKSVRQSRTNQTPAAPTEPEAFVHQRETKPAVDSPNRLAGESLEYAGKE